MRKFLVSVALASLSVVAFASATATKEDVKALVKQAVTFVKANGRDQFFKEVRVSEGQFHFRIGTKKDLYIFVYDEKGTVLAHGARVDLNGRNRWNDKDPDGKAWIQDWTDLVHKSGSGWIGYKEFSPADKNKVMDKASFVELTDGMVIGCGIYGK